MASRPKNGSSALQIVFTALKFRASVGDEPCCFLHVIIGARCMEGCCTKAFIHQIIEKIKLECSNSHDMTLWIFLLYVSFYLFS
jgi:hypothetical protein